jgi:hypothetical protein
MIVNYHRIFEPENLLPLSLTKLCSTFGEKSPGELALLNILQLEDFSSLIVAACLAEEMSQLWLMALWAF